MLGSFLRFSGVGLFVTVCSVVSYWLLASRLQMDPNLSLLLVFIVFTVVGHYLHGVFSFADRSGGKLSGATLVRFTIANLIGFGVNQLFITFLVKLYGYPNWIPVLPMIAVTPFIVFAINRFWVFNHVKQDGGSASGS